MCNICNKPNCNCIVSQTPVDCDPCLQEKYCKEKIDTDCVYYNLNEPNAPSNLVCMGINSNTSLTAILTRIDQLLCGFENPFMILGGTTDTAQVVTSNVGSIYTVFANVKIDPASTLPYSISPAGIKLDCCDPEPFDCSGTYILLDTSLASITRASSFYDVLNPNYFVKSDTIQEVVFADSSVLGGDGLTYLKYTSTLPLGLNSFNTLGGFCTINCNTCASTMTSAVGSLLLEMQTQRGCYDSKLYSLETSRVPYSERYAYPYRFNAQINDTPIVSDPLTPSIMDKGILYFNDTYFLTPGTSNGSVVRKLNLNTKEVRTISGDITSGTFNKVDDGAIGSVVRYNYSSSINADKSEVYNGEPVLYFANFGQSTVGSPVGGCIVRVVKEQSNNCDERDNWVSYVIANPDNILGTTATDALTPGSTINFRNLYGIKRWFDVNNAPSFYIVETAPVPSSGVPRIKYLYYTGVGSRNIASNWRVATVAIDADPDIFPVDCNINVEDIELRNEETGEDYATKRLIIFFDGKIRFYDWASAIPPAPISSYEIDTLSNFIFTEVANGATSSTDGSYPGLATVDKPNYIYKYTNPSLAFNHYVFGQGSPTGGYTTNERQVRLFEYSGLTYDYTTILPGTNSAQVGTSGLPAAVNGYSEGFFTDLQNNLYDFTLGGVRSWDLSSATSSIYAGGDSALAVQTQYAQLPNPLRMDTQYQLILV